MLLRRAADETGSACTLAPAIHALVPRRGAAMMQYALPVPRCKTRTVVKAKVPLQIQ